MTDAAKTIDVPDASTPRLTCYFKSRSEATDGETVDSVSRKAFLFQETGKKSSYVLQQQIESPGNEVKDANNPATQRDNIDYYSIPKPSHFVVEHVHPNSNTSSHFFFRRVSNHIYEKNVRNLFNKSGREGNLPDDV